MHCVRVSIQTSKCWLDMAAIATLAVPTRGNALCKDGCRLICMRGKITADQSCSASTNELFDDPFNDPGLRDGQEHGKNSGREAGPPFGHSTLFVGILSGPID